MFPGLLLTVDRKKAIVSFANTQINTVLDKKTQHCRSSTQNFYCFITIKKQTSYNLRTFYRYLNVTDFISVFFLFFFYYSTVSMHHLLFSFHILLVLHFFSIAVIYFKHIFTVQRPFRAIFHPTLPQPILACTMVALPLQFHLNSFER